MIHAEAGDNCAFPGWESRRLWSLWDMLQKFAWQFYVLSSLLERLERDLTAQPDLPLLPPPSSDQPSNLGGLFSLGLPVSRKQLAALTPEKRDHIANLLGLIRDCCTDIGMGNIKPEIDRIMKEIPISTDEKRIAQHIEHLSNRIADDLREREFYYIPIDKVKYFNSLEVYNGALLSKFSKILEDITRAGQCYAFSQNTACVFHLMRVMEYCVQRFGRKLQVTIDPTRESWHQIMMHVNNQINAMPGGAKATKAQTSKKEKYAAAAARLDNVRIAWRNNVMHPKATYDEKEALEVLNSVGAFLENVKDLI